MTTLALSLITAATAEAHEKHGRSFEAASLADRMLIMGEEFGEIARAVMDLAAARAAADTWREMAPGTLAVLRSAHEAVRAAQAHVLHEVAQLGSLCMRWLEVDGAK